MQTDAESSNLKADTKSLDMKEGQRLIDKINAILNREIYPDPNWTNSSILSLYKTCNEYYLDRRLADLEDAGQQLLSMILGSIHESIKSNTSININYIQIVCDIHNKWQTA